MFNIILLALALRIICRRYASVHHSDLSSSGQARARSDVESPRLKQPNATVVVQPDDQVSQRLPIVGQAEDESNNRKLPSTLYAIPWSPGIAIEMRGRGQGLSCTQVKQPVSDVG